MDPVRHVPDVRTPAGGNIVECEHIWLRCNEYYRAAVNHPIVVDHERMFSTGGRRRKPFWDYDQELPLANRFYARGRTSDSYSDAAQLDRQLRHPVK